MSGERDNIHRVFFDSYFGTAFRKAAEETQVRIHFDGFDSWSLYLDANDLTRFMQFLQSVLVG